MIAGPNGSGKSTLIEMLRKQGIDFGVYLNADDIARTMQGNGANVAAEAQKEVRRLRALAVEEKKDHTFETVLSHPSHIDHLRYAKSTGFEVVVYFVATDDPLINIGRVANRVERGGHDVPSDRIVARYHRSIANLAEALAVADEGAVFDNSSQSETMRLIARWEDGQLVQTQSETRRPIWWHQFTSQIWSKRL
jgi:predicted ABC-type ATPase